MKLSVQKFGGSSVSSPEKIRRVATKVVEARRQGYHVVVVVSAMGKTTDQLVRLAGQVSEHPSARELDLLMASGEQISSSLLAMAINNLGYEAVALAGRKNGIRTSEQHGGAQVTEVCTSGILRELSLGRVVVVAGFQGTDARAELTTLGRGGSDTSAVALAAALGVEVCEIFTDVDGVYSADPRIIPSARRLPEIDHDQMRALAQHGARVLHVESIEYARRHRVAIHVRSTFGRGEGTWIRPAEKIDPYDRAVHPVAGIAGRKDLLGIKMAGRDPRRFLEMVRETTNCEHDHLLSAPGESNAPGYDLLVSSEGIVDEEHFASNLEESFPGVEVATNLGSVSAIGPGVEQQADLRRQIEVSLSPSPITCYSNPNSLSCLIEAPHFESSARHLHATFVEPGFEAGSARMASP